MIQEFCTNIYQNKNLLMLVTVGVYILALFAVLSSSVILFSLLISLVLIFLLLKNLMPFKYIIVWLIVFYLGIFNTSSRLQNTDDLLNIAPVNSTIYGKIVSIPQVKNDKTKFFFEVDKIEFDSISEELTNIKTLVTLNTNEKLKIYDSYKVDGRLSIPFKAGNPSQFDYGNYLRNYGTYSVFYGKDFVKTETNLNYKEKFLQWVNDYREKILAIHAKNLNSPNLEILGGIIFGDDAVSPPENIKQSFINSGLLHILAASGMNVAFIFSFFYLILSLIKVPYKLNVSFCIIMVCIYSLMTGLGPSIVRATFMLVFVLLGKLIDRDAHSISLLAFVAFLMLLYNPMYINDIGFQLSFIVTLGLLLMTPYLITGKHKITNWIIGTVSIPVIAQMWVIPIQIFYFNNISLYSVFANIMSVPILSVISFGGFVSSLIATITPEFVCRIFDIILNPLITILVNISDFWGNLPHASTQTSHPNVFQLILYYGILLNITAFFNGEIREKYSKFLKIMFFTMFAILLILFINIPNKNLEITAFDVGNADSFLIKTPKNEYIMIDTGKSGYNGGKSQAGIFMLKYLLDSGIKTIDTIIVTHFDNDHCGGAVDLINGVKIKHLYVNSLNHDSLAAKEIYKTAREKNVQLISGENKQVVYDSSGLKLTNFISKDATESDDNETSILTLIEYKDFKMLFTGDSGISSFESLKSYLPENITVLKVGHHGALESVNKDMADYLKPKYSLISIGENKFGHPSVFTLESLKNSKILRTDMHNSIKLVVNKKLKIYTYDIKKKKYTILSHK